MLNSLSLVDFGIVGVIVLSILISLWRGFLKEVISLAAWVSAFVIAFVFVDEGAALLVNYIDVPSVRLTLAFGGLFLVTLILGGLVNLTVAQLVKYTGLSGTDRLLGTVFGLLRGMAIITILVLLAGLTPLPKDPWWNQSSLIPHFQTMALWLQDLLPPEYAEHFMFS